MGKVAILGSGNAACSYSAYLGKRGHEVRLWDQPCFWENLAPIKEKGGMDMIGVDTGFGPISLVTSDLEEAIKGIDIIMVVVPSFGHKTFAELLAPYLKDDMIVVLNPGAVFGGLEFLNTVRKCGNKAKFIVGELASNIFACRRSGPTQVNIQGKKETIETAAIPASRVNEMIARLDQFFPGTYVPVKNAIATSLGYNNLIIHPAGTLLNMGRIENTEGKFDFYWEGLTPGVCKNIEAVDRERIAVGRALGIELESFIEISQKYYGHPERKTVYDFFSRSEVHGGWGTYTAPPHMHTRYVTEDVPFALVPLSAVAKLVGVETPTIDGLIAIASNCNDEDYKTTGRTLDKIGLAGLDAKGILEVFEKGL